MALFVEYIRNKLKQVHGWCAVFIQDIFHTQITEYRAFNYSYHKKLSIYLSVFQLIVYININVCMCINVHDMNRFDSFFFKKCTGILR